MQEPIGASELIITDKGRVYHLDMHPDDLGDIVITVGDPDRVPLVSRYFDRVNVKRAHREFISHSGVLAGKTITVLSTGIGPDNIDIALNELDALANIDFDTRLPKEHHRTLTIIRLGTSGSLQASIPVDALVASTFGIGLDNMLHYYRHTYNAEENYLLGAFLQHTGLGGNTPVQPYIAEGSIGLLNYFTNAEFFRGITVTCPGFFGPQGRVLRLPLAFPDLIDKLASFSNGPHFVSNFEMETSAIYGLGKLMGHHCLSVNTIIANRQNKTFTSNGEAAVDNMIVKSLEIIANIK